LYNKKVENCLTTYIFFTLNQNVKLFDNLLLILCLV